MVISCCKSFSPRSVTPNYSRLIKVLGSNPPSFKSEWYFTRIKGKVT